MSSPRPDFAIAFDVPTLAEALALNEKLGEGDEYAKLGLELFVAEGTAKGHIRSIMAKTRVDRRAGLVRYAIENGIPVAEE